MSLRDEHNDPVDDYMIHNPTRGERKRDGLAVIGDAVHLDTRVADNKLVARTTSMR